VDRAAGDERPKSRAPANIRDVARLAGVSPATVSRVIRVSDYPVKTETRQRVLDAAAQLHFYPNDLARGLFGERTNTIGVLVPDASNPYYPEILRGVERVAFEHRIAVIFCNVDHQADRQRYYLDVLMQRRVDGLIGVGGDYDYRSSQEALERMSMRLVLIGRHDELDYPTVETPDAEGGERATRHLIDLGHRDIAFVTGSETSLASQDRLTGYRRALEAAGLPVRPELIVKGDYQESSGYARTRELLDIPRPPSAIVAANDRMALGVMAAAWDLGAEVPGALSVVGFDNIASSKYVRPSLTTVESPGHHAGEKAMELMLGLIDGVDVPRRTVMPCELIVRGSTGPRR